MHALKIPFFLIVTVLILGVVSCDKEIPLAGGGRRPIIPVGGGRPRRPWNSEDLNRAVRAVADALNRDLATHDLIEIKTWKGDEYYLGGRAKLVIKGRGVDPTTTIVKYLGCHEHAAPAGGFGATMDCHVMDYALRPPNEPAD